MSTGRAPSRMPRAIALVSGGLDSPVAVARMLAAGWDIVPVHCSQEPIVGPEAEDKTAACLQHLADASGPLGEEAAGRLLTDLIVVPVADALARFTEPAAHRDYHVHMKRLFNAIASVIASEHDCTHILTGENLGQVSSQTLGNLGAVEAASTLPLLRPLLGWDKLEIVDVAQRLGTFELAKGPEVCDALGPKHPTTVAHMERIDVNEAMSGGLDALAAGCLKGRTIRSVAPVLLA